MRSFKTFSSLMTYENSGSAILADGVVVLGNSRIGIAENNIATGGKGTVHLEGVFELDAVNDDAFDQGEQLYWNVAEQKLTAEADGNIPAGIAFQAKEETDTVVQVRLQGLASAGGGGFGTIDNFFWGDAKGIVSPNGGDASIILFGAEDSGVSGNLDLVVVQGGSITEAAAVGNAGDAYIVGGYNVGDGLGGTVKVLGGDAENGGGGDIQIAAGPSYANGNGGELIMSSGHASAGNSGNISLTTGNASGTRGNITMSAPKIVVTGNGVVFPSLAADPASPTAGQVYFNTGSAKLKVYTGSGWETITSSQAYILL